MKKALSAFVFDAALVVGLAAMVPVVSVHAAEEYNSNVTYQQIATKAAQTSGPAVDIHTNYWLAWTGAWDTVVMKEMKIAEKWLPKGSTVHWKRNLQGPPVITDLLANKQQIGYIGDNPSLVAASKRSIAPLNIVAVNTMSPGRMCGTILVRKDAPQFHDIKDVFKWLNGKVVGVPRGSCADRLGRFMVEKEGVHVTWQQMQAAVTVTSLGAGKIDAASLYEPHSSKAVFKGYARYAVSPAVFGESDANTIVMREDFIKQHRAAAVAWLKADIEALYFVRDHPIKTIDIVKAELPDYSRENLWFAIYGVPPKSTGASSTVIEAPMVFTPAVKSLLVRGNEFLHKIKLVQDPKLATGALEGDLIVEAFKELGLDPQKGLFAIQAKQNPFKGDDLVKK